MKVSTGKVRLVYISLKEPSAPPGSTRLTYNVCCLVDKEDEFTLNKLKQAFNKCLEEGKKNCKEWKGKRPKGLTFESSLRDMEEDNEAEWAEDKWGFNPKTNYEPKVINRELQPVAVEDCYNGMYARINVSPYAYGHPSGGKGIAWNLNSIMMLDGGEEIHMDFNPASDYDNEEDDYEYEDEDDI